MFCKKCGSPVKDDAKFCGKCGTPVVKGQPQNSEREAPPSSVRAELQKPPAPQAPKPLSRQERPSTQGSYTGERSNKKVILISAVTAALLAAGSAGGWWYLKKTGNTSEAAPVAAASVPAQAAVTVGAKAPADDQVATATGAAATVAAVQPVALPASPYIGQAISSKYYVSQFDQVGSFKVYKVHDETGITKRVLVTDQADRITDAREISESNRVLVSGRNGCAVNGKPYPGIYAMGLLNKLAPPSEVWKLDSQGKLVNENVPGIQCGAFANVDGDDGEYAAPPQPAASAAVQPQATVQPSNAPTKPKKPLLKSAERKAEPASEPQPVQHDQAPVAKRAPEPPPPVQTTQQDQPSQEKKLDVFFNKLVNSIKNNGTTEKQCTSAETSMHVNGC